MARPIQSVLQDAPFPIPKEVLDLAEDELTNWDLPKGLKPQTVSREGIVYTLTQSRVQDNITRVRSWKTATKRWKNDVRQFALAFDHGRDWERRYPAE